MNVMIRSGNERKMKTQDPKIGTYYKNNENKRKKTIEK